MTKICKQVREVTTLHDAYNNSLDQADAKDNEKIKGQEKKKMKKLHLKVEGYGMSYSENEKENFQTHDKKIL